MRDIFVFGSNLAGRHGKGAALYAAKNFGAERGVGEGETGDSYAIPTKDENLQTLPLSAVEAAIVRFINQARGCLLYTSDAADDMQCVDLGGRRIIKKRVG